MKTLYESLLDDFDKIKDAADPKATVKQFLKDNYSTPINQFVISKEPNKNGLYEVMCKDKIVKLNNQDNRLTNGIFKFVNRPRKKIEISCTGDIESLEGLPKQVERLEINANKKIHSLKDISGWPEVVDHLVLCACPNLVSLTGGPDKITKVVDIQYLGKKFSAEDIRREMNVGYTINIYRVL